MEVMRKLARSNLNEQVLFECQPVAIPYVTKDSTLRCRGVIGREPALQAYRTTSQQYRSSTLKESRMEILLVLLLV